MSCGSAVKRWVSLCGVQVSSPSGGLLHRVNLDVRLDIYVNVSVGVYVCFARVHTPACVYVTGRVSSEFRTLIDVGGAYADRTAASYNSEAGM